MLEDMRKIVRILEKNHQTISTMESCTGGGLANLITNVGGASDVFHFSAVTYSNEYKIKMGVPKEIIEKYTVYSQETADAMSKAISEFSNSDYGIGITGLLNVADPENPVDMKNKIYISIYDSKLEKYYKKQIEVHEFVRYLNKNTVLRGVLALFLEILA